MKQLWNVINGLEARKDVKAKVFLWLLAVANILIGAGLWLLIGRIFLPGTEWLMFIKGTPALKEVGVSDLLFGTIWKPTASNPSFGIGYIILTSIVGTGAAILIGMPIGLLTAVFLSEMAGKRLGTVVGSAVELLAAIPSVIYGLIGMMVLNPIMFKIERIHFL